MAMLSLRVPGTLTLGQQGRPSAVLDGGPLLHVGGLRYHTPLSSWDLVTRSCLGGLCRVGASSVSRSVCSVVVGGGRAKSSSRQSSQTRYGAARPRVARLSSRRLTVFWRTAVKTVMILSFRGSS